MQRLFFLSRETRYNSNHVLHRLLPNLKVDVNAVMKQNFVYRMVFKDNY